jgi:hypothetical protein
MSMPLTALARGAVAGVALLSGFARAQTPSPAAPKPSGEAWQIVAQASPASSMVVMGP